MYWIFVNYYGLIGDYSNGLVVCWNVDVIFFFIFEDFMLCICFDILYYYDVVKNIIILCFIIDYVVFEN